MMQFFGLTAEDYADEETVWLWPDNVEAVNLFYDMRSQWRTNMNGPYGLDYGPLFHKMDRMGLTPERYEELEEEIRVLEQAALAEMRTYD
jgi:hypothetical protein